MQRGHRPLCQRDPRRPARRARRHRGQRHAAARFRRPPSRPQPGPRQGPLRPDDGPGRARFRRRLGRRRRPQPDHRPRHLRHAVATAWRCSPPTRIWRRAMPGGLDGHRPLDADQRRGRPRGREARHRHATRRRPAGSSSATCSMPAWPRSAARRVPAPAPTMSARRTGCGRCCSGSTSWPRAASQRRADRARALGDLRPQLLFAATTTRRSTRDGANALMDDLRAQLAALPGTQRGAA